MQNVEADLETTEPTFIFVSNIHDYGYLMSSIRKGKE
jgi:hypothetical protein